MIAGDLHALDAVIGRPGCACCIDEQKRHILHQDIGNPLIRLRARSLIRSGATLRRQLGDLLIAVASDVRVKSYRIRRRSPNPMDR